jgi:hypothetical protein
MALTEEQQDVWQKLQNAPKQSFADAILHTPNDVSLETPGIYAIWDGNELIYIGNALLKRPEGSLKKRLWGLKDRLHSHRAGQISGSSVALALWFCRIAPALSQDEHKAISDRKINPSARTEAAIQKLCYTCCPVDELEVGQIEAALYRNLKPELNEYQEFVRIDSWNRKQKTLKAQKAQLAQPAASTGEEA